MKPNAQLAFHLMSIYYSYTALEEKKYKNDDKKNFIYEHKFTLSFLSRQSCLWCYVAGGLSILRVLLNLILAKLVVKKCYRF